MATFETALTFPGSSNPKPVRFPRAGVVRGAVAGLLLLARAAWAEERPGPSEAAASSPSRYTVDDCLRIGLQRSAVAVNARRDREIAGAQVRQAWSAALPRVWSSASYTRLDEVPRIEFEGQSLEMGAADNYGAKLQVDQLLYSGGKVGAALRAASLAEQYAASALADAEARLERDIRTGFHDLLLAGAAVRVRAESVAQLEALLVQTERRRSSGTASEFDVLTAKVRVANERPELIRARNGRDVAAAAFRRLVGLPEAPFELEGELICVPFPEDLTNLCEQAVLRRPALGAMETGVRLKEQDVVAARAGYFPSVNAFFRYDGANPYGMGTRDEWEWHWTAGLVLQWAIWDSGLTRGVVEEKRLVLDKMRTDLEDFRSAVRLEVTQAYLEMRRALETVEAGKGNVELAQKALAVAKTRHDTGAATYLEYTDANLALRTAELTLLNALRDHMNAVVRLRYAAGLENGAPKKEIPK